MYIYILLSFQSYLQTKKPVRNICMPNISFPQSKIQGQRLFGFTEIPIASSLTK